MKIHCFTIWHQFIAVSGPLFMRLVDSTQNTFRQQLMRFKQKFPYTSKNYWVTLFVIFYVKFKELSNVSDFPVLMTTLKILAKAGSIPGGMSGKHHVQVLLSGSFDFCSFLSHTNATLNYGGIFKNNIIFQHLWTFSLEMKFGRAFIACWKTITSTPLPLATKVEDNEGLFLNNHYYFINSQSRKKGEEDWRKGG